MAEPGDPDRPADPASPRRTDTRVDPNPDLRRGRPPSDDHSAHDDLIGFSSSAALAGRVRRDAAAEQTAPVPESGAPVLPAWARLTPSAAKIPSPDPHFGRRAEAAAPIEGVMGLYAVYALILFAVPTLGVSALIALFAVSRRAAPETEPALSHFTFQRRTLWTAAAAAIAGAVLIVINLGVFVLFAMAVWVVTRGAVGVFRLKAGQPMPRPRTWLI